MSVELKQIQNSVLTFEESIAREATLAEYSKFRDFIERNILFPAKREKERLSDLREFIEETIFAKRYSVNLRDPQIQHLFDQALEKVIQIDCAKLSLVYQNKVQDKMTSAMVGMHRKQQEAHVWQKRGTWGKIQATAVQFYRERIKQSPKKPPIYENAEEDFIVIESGGDKRNKRVLSLLKEWEQKPSLVIPLTHAAQGIKVLRDTFLPKARTIVLETPQEERMRKAAPPYQLKRIV